MKFTSLALAFTLMALTGVLIVPALPLIKRCLPYAVTHPVYYFGIAALFLMYEWRCAQRLP